MKKYIITLFLIFIIIPALAQSSYHNLEKYWFYRYRLVNDFMKIGTGCGESIPAQSRIYPDRWGNQGNTLTWEDATVYLGNYIGALSLEYRMLKDNHWNTERTELELYYALMAIKRLDESAESYDANIDANSPCNPQPWGAPFGPIWNNNTHGSLNGFFLRDDVWYNNTIPGKIQAKTPDFVSTNMEHFNRPGSYYHPNHDVGGVLGSLPYTSFSSVTPLSDTLPMNKIHHVLNCAAWSASRPDHGYPAGVPRYSNEESQDQAQAMFMGLSMATNILDYGTIVSGMDIRQEAATTAKRIVSWFPKPFISPASIIPPFFVEDIPAVALFGPVSWSIKNPLTMRCVNTKDPSDYGGADMCTSGAWGPNFYCFSAARAVLKSPGLHYSALLPECMTLVGQSSFPTFELAFQLSQLSTITSTGGLRDLTFADGYTAVSGAWRASILNTSWHAIRNHAMASHFCSPHYPLIYRINFSKPGIGFSPESHVGISYEHLLNVAPECGPYHRSVLGDDIHTYADREWSGSDRLNEFFHRDGFDEPGYDYRLYSNRDFNGTDYLFLFNLYAFHKGDYLDFIFNPYYVTKYDKAYPHATWGTDLQPLKLNFLEYLSCINKIGSGANVIFRSAHETELLPGFEARNCTFEAIVRDYVCMSEPGIGDANEDYHFAYLNGVPFEYNPTDAPYIPRMFSDSDYINSYLEDSLALSPLAQDGITTLRDSVRHYLQHTNDPALMEFMVRYGFISQDGTFPITSPLIPEKTIRYSDWVEVSPNPANNFANVSYELFEANKIEITVYNILGQDFSIYINPYNKEEKKGKYNTFINVSEFAKGIYYVKIVIGRQVVIKKLTVI